MSINRPRLSEGLEDPHHSISPNWYLSVSLYYLVILPFTKNNSLIRIAGVEKLLI